MPRLQFIARMPPIALPAVKLMPCAGLANRMRAIASALTYTREVGGTLVIGWKFDPGALEAPFRDIFDMTALPPNVQVVEMGAQPDFAWNNGPEANSVAAWDALTAANAGTPVLQFKSWAAFYKPGEPEWLDALRALRPHPVLDARATALLAAARSRPVGVHIRRTDHHKATAASPSAAFWTTMDANPSMFYYVASDDDRERREAQRQFPQQILLQSAARLERTSTVGIQGAMVDFVCLSRCSKVLGSAGSSFGEIAAAYGSIPFVPVQKENGPPKSSR
jgi:hypothetical protein